MYARIRALSIGIRFVSISSANAMDVCATELRGVGNGRRGARARARAGWRRAAEKIGRIIRMSERMSGERAFDVFSSERKMKIHAEQT